MTNEEILCLSYFDTIIGPNIFYCSNNSSKDELEYPDLRRILEFNEEEGTFIFAFRKYQTVNYLFYMDSDLARGGQELLMITYMIRASYFRNEIVDVFKYLDSKGPTLKKFAEKVKELDELPEILHKDKTEYKSQNLHLLGSKKFRREFISLFNNYRKNLSPKNIRPIPMESRDNLKKIFVFGANRVGKSTFLKNIEAIQFHNQENQDLPTVIYEFVIENIQIISPDCYERELECKYCENLGGCISNAQGFILLFNASDKNTLIDAKERFKLIVERCEEFQGKNGKIPVVIIGNKFKKNEDVSRENVYSTFNLPQLDDCGIIIQYFPLNILIDNEKIMEAIRWLVKNMI